MKDSQHNIFDLPELREKTRIFEDRTHAGAVLAKMLEAFQQENGIIFGIPAGGVPVGAEIAGRLGLTFDVAVVSKITLPWNTEAGYGAIAFDGTLRLNKDMVRRVRLTEEDVQMGIEKTTAKVARRVEELRRQQPFPVLSRRSVVLVDDGLASGFTMLVAIEALRTSGAERIIVAVPTGSRRSVERIAGEVEALYCANIRGGWSFAVASAYQHWSDVAEEDVIRILEEVKLSALKGGGSAL
jgi:predicted phosphoribosyltransferase